MNRHGCGHSFLCPNVVSRQIGESRKGGKHMEPHHNNGRVSRQISVGEMCRDAMVYSLQNCPGHALVPWVYWTKRLQRTAWSVIRNILPLLSCTNDQANLKSAYYKLDNGKLDVTSNPPVYKKLLFALCFFHASVQVWHDYCLWQH